MTSLNTKILVSIRHFSSSQGTYSSSVSKPSVDHSSDTVSTVYPPPQVSPVAPSVSVPRQSSPSSKDESDNTDVCVLKYDKFGKDIDRRPMLNIRIVDLHIISHLTDNYCVITKLHQSESWGVSLGIPKSNLRDTWKLCPVNHYWTYFTFHKHHVQLYQMHSSSISTVFLDVCTTVKILYIIRKLWISGGGTDI